MLKKCLDCVKNIKLDKVAVFAGGVLFGTAGLKVLGSKDAKKVYTQGTAAVLRAKDCVMKTTNVVQENAEDILAEAKQINEKRYEKENSVEEAEEAEETTEATEAKGTRVLITGPMAPFFFGGVNMRFQIKHEIEGRLRVHMMQNRMTFAEADTLQYYLEGLPVVAHAKVYEKTCDAVVTYTAERADIITALKQFCPLFHA